MPEVLTAMQGLSCVFVVPTEPLLSFMHQGAREARGRAESPQQNKPYLLSCGTRHNTSCSLVQPTRPSSRSWLLSAGHCCLHLCSRSNSSYTGELLAVVGHLLEGLNDSTNLI